MRNPIPWGVLKPPPPFLEMVRGGGLRVFFDAHTSFVRFFFWCCSFGLHIQSFVLAPNSATFDFIPLARDPPQCKGDVAFPPFFLDISDFAPRFEVVGIPNTAGVR